MDCVKACKTLKGEITLWKMNCLRQDGYTLIEMLIALLIVTFSMSLVTGVYTLLTRLDTSTIQAQDDLAFYQIRLRFALSKEHTIEGNVFSFLYENEWQSYVFYEGKLIIQPGYQVVLQSIQSITYDVKDDCYFAIYERENIHYERIMGC